MRNILATILFGFLLLPTLVVASEETRTEQEVFDAWIKHYEPGLAALKSASYDDARDLLSQAYLEVKDFGPSPALASTYSSLGALYEKTADLATAKKLYESAVSISQQSRGTHHPETAMDLYNLASVEKQLKQHDAAAQHVAYAVDIMRKTGLGKTVPTKVMIQLLADLYEDKGEQDTADKLRAAIQEVEWEMQ